MIFQQLTACQSVCAPHPALHCGLLDDVLQPLLVVPACFRTGALFVLRFLRHTDTAHYKHVTLISTRGARCYVCPSLTGAGFRSSISCSALLIFSCSISLLMVCLAWYVSWRRGGRPGNLTTSSTRLETRSKHKQTRRSLFTRSKHKCTCDATDIRLNPVR